MGYCSCQHYRQCHCSVSVIYPVFVSISDHVNPSVDIAVSVLEKNKNKKGFRLLVCLVKCVSNCIPIVSVLVSIPVLVSVVFLVKLMSVFLSVLGL